MIHLRRNHLAGAALVALAILSNPATAEDAKGVEPQAREVVEKLSASLAGHERVRFRVHDTIDVIDETGQKIQYEHARTIEVERPDKLRTSAHGDLRNAEAWFDGDGADVLLTKQNVWGTIEFEGGVDGMLQYASEVLGMQLPAADLASNDLANLILSNADTVRYLGVRQAGGVPCDHIAFSNGNIDGQLWVTQGDAPEPRKLVIDYKLLAGEPQFRLDVDAVEYPASYPDGYFTFTPPKDAEKVDLVPIAEAARPAKKDE